MANNEQEQAICKFIEDTLASKDNPVKSDDKGFEFLVDMLQTITKDNPDRLHALINIVLTIYEKDDEELHIKLPQPSVHLEQSSEHGALCNIYAIFKNVERYYLYKDSEYLNVAATYIVNEITRSIKSRKNSRNK